MNVAQIRKLDIANGEGVGVALFVSGCTHNCPGCFNQEYQNFKYGKTWDDFRLIELLKALSNPNTKRFTVLGGEPFDQIKDEDLLNVLSHVKGWYDHTIWIYSGYTYEEIMSHPKRKRLLDYCDILVDGKYEQELYDWRLKFKGSSNQRIIDLNKTRETGEVTLYA